MATILFGPMVTGARGKLAGTIFSANGSGPYVRGWSRGSNPRSPLQTAARNQLMQFGPLWADLTSAQRDDWNDYAAASAQELTNSLGEGYFISGFNWYLKINSQLAAADEAAIDDAPTNTRPSAPVIQSWLPNPTGGGADTRVKMDAASPHLAENHVIFARLFTSKGRTAASHNFTFMTIAVPDGNRVIKFQNEAENAFGDIALNMRMFGEVYVQDDEGQRSAVATANSVVQNL